MSLEDDRPGPSPFQVRPSAERRRVTESMLESVPQLEPLNLPRAGFWQAVHDLDPARILPHADLLLDVLLERLAQRFGVFPLRVVLERDVGLRPQQPVG